MDAERVFLNSQVSGLSLPNCWADFDNAVVQPGSNPEALASADDSGDHANLAFAGFQALAPSVLNLGGFCLLMPSSSPLPASP